MKPADRIICGDISSKRPGTRKGTGEWEVVSPPVKLPAKGKP